MRQLPTTGPVLPLRTAIALAQRELDYIISSRETMDPLKLERALDHLNSMLESVSAEAECLRREFTLRVINSAGSGTEPPLFPDSYLG